MIQNDQRIRVLITDDQRPARQGLHALLATCPEIKVIGEAANGQEALRLVAEYRPDVVLMDVRMPVMDGITATALIKHQWPSIRVLILTLYGTHRMEALQAGADAFIIKGSPLDELVEAILAAGVPQADAQR